MMRKSYLAVLFALASTVVFVMCKKKSDDPQPEASEEVDTSCQDFNLFGVARDREFGKQAFDFYSNKDSSGNIVLDSATYSKAYQYLYSIRNEILDKNNVNNEKEFEWKMRIIKDDTTLNAFCTPGGYIFVYTGIIKYLDSEDDFAGVLGHEMGHAALRHSTNTMTKQYGTSIFLDALGLGSSKLIGAIRGLKSLSYSRCHETQADEYSVVLLANTKYKCDGAASFFQKLIDSGAAGGTPEFLSTHPNPDNRVQFIDAKATNLKCSKTPSATSTAWAQFKTDLGL